MLRKGKFVSEVVLVAGAQVGGQAANLARNILLARLLGPAEMGIAAMLGLAMTLLEMISDVAAEEMLVTGERADDASLQSTLHGLRVIRCAAIGMVFLAASPLIVGWFGLPGDPMSIALCTVVLLVRGFAHSDIDRFIRERRFGPYAAVQLVPQCVALAAAYPAAKYFGDYRAVLALLLAHGMTAIAISHLVATRAYRVGLDRKWLPGVWKFGGPILANGFLLFAVFQGDRFIVGTFYDPVDMGIFVTALGLALVPALLMARINSTLLLPRLASRRDSAGGLAAGWGATCAVLGVLCVGMAVGFVLAGPWLLPLVYGSAFAAGAALIGVIGVGQGLFLLRDSQNVVAMARNDTRHPLLGNAIRLGAIPVSAWIASRGGSLVAVAWVMVLAEYVSLVVSSARLGRVHGMRMGDSVVAGTAVLVAGVGGTLVMAGHGWVGGCAVVAAAGVVGVRAWRCVGLVGRRSNGVVAGVGGVAA